MRNFTDIKRVVLKLGTNSLMRGNCLDSQYIMDIAAQTKELHEKELQVLLVTSGAIGLGASELGITEGVKNIKMRQACAAIGQPILMHYYREAFRQKGILIAQVLLTQEVLETRKSFVNLKNSVQTLLSLGVVPIINENDCISTEEIGNAFGDNDTLSAYIASKIDADLLLILSDIDAYYDRDPRKDSEAKPIRTVQKVTHEMLQNSGKPGSTFSTGGMRTKLKAVQITEKADCRTIIANAREPRIIPRIIEGENIGTLFLPSLHKLKNRQRWILNTTPRGKLLIDAGALTAIRNHKSLLPSGVLKIEGVFKAGDVIKVNDVAKLITAFDSEQLERIRGLHSSQIQEILGEHARDVIARPEDMVFIEQ